jgi:hypothetical protein
MLLAFVHDDSSPWITVTVLAIFAFVLLLGAIFPHWEYKWSTRHTRGPGIPMSVLGRVAGGSFCGWFAILFAVNPPEPLSKVGFAIGMVIFVFTGIVVLRDRAADRKRRDF